MAEKAGSQVIGWVHVIAGMVVLSVLAVYCLTYADAAAQPYMKEERTLSNAAAILFSLRWAMALSPVMYLWAIYVLMRRKAPPRTIMKTTYVFLAGGVLYTSALTASL